MGKLNLNSVKEMIDEVLYADNEKYSVKFDLFSSENSVFTEDKSHVSLLKANMKVQIHKTREKVNLTIDLLKIPHYGPTGYTVRGRNLQVIDLYEKAYSWYLLEGDGTIPTPYLQLSPESGRMIIVTEKDFKLFVTTDRKRTGERSISLAVFLKTFTGMTFPELASVLGSESIYIVKTFLSEEEPNRVECIDMTYKALFSYKQGNYNPVETSRLGPEEKFNKMSEMLFSLNGLVLGEATGPRMKQTLSYKYRAKGLVLAETIRTEKRTYHKNSILTPKDLDELDHLPLDSIKVYDNERRLHVLRKTTTLYFQALDTVLYEDVVCKNKVVLKAGTQLTLNVLQMLDDIDELGSIIVDSGIGVIEVKRRVVSRVLEINDLIAMCQVYIENLSGINKSHNIYDLDNQNLVGIDTKTKSYIKKYLEFLIEMVARYERTAGENSTNLLTELLDIPPNDVDVLINEITSVETKNTQPVELNNSIQKTSKEFFLSKDVKRSNEKMVEIQPSQLWRLDLFESPESNKIGLRKTRTFLSRMDDMGFLLAPLLPVSAGKILSTEPVYLNQVAQEGKNIAEWCETFVELDINGNEVKKDFVRVFRDGNIIYVPVDSVDYIEYSCYQSMSPARMCTLFSEFNAQKRTLMTINHSKQAIPPLYAERSRVSPAGKSIILNSLIRARDLLNDYYFENQTTMKDIPREKFIESKLKLFSSDYQNINRTLFFKVVGMEDVILSLTVPSSQKSSKFSWFRYNINTKTNLIYQGDDIVVYPFDVDIEDYTLNKKVNFGNQNIDDRVFDQAIAIGTNVIIALKTHEASTNDDSFVIGSDLQTKGTLSYVYLHEESYELSSPESSVDGMRKYEEFGFSSEKTPAHMEATGLPKLNSLVRPGDVVIGVVRRKYNGSELIDIKPVPKVLTGRVEGKVVNAYFEGNKAKVVICTIRQIEEGDKLAGGHGNKGVIGKIVPQCEMPFDPETGLQVDVIVSNLTVPSRMNVGQILEMRLGLAGLLTDQYYVVSPFKDDILDFVQEESDKAGVHSILLRDGRTGQLFDRPVNVGCVTLLTLEHKVVDKIAGIGFTNKVDPIYNQPVKGGGGQAWGEMETWVLMAYEAPHMLQEVMSIGSDDLQSIAMYAEAIDKGVTKVEMDGNNNNDEIFQVIFRCLSTEAIVEETGDMKFVPLTDNMVRGIAANNAIDIHNRDTLRSPSIFGGVYSPSSSYKNRKNWGYLDLGVEIVHPFWVIKGKISKFILIYKVEVKKKTNGEEERKLVEQPLTTKDLKSLIKGTSHLVPFESARSYLGFTMEEEGEISRISPTTKYVIIKGSSEKYLSGMPSVVELLKKTKVEDMIEYYKGKLDGVKSPHKRDEYLKNIRHMEDFIASGVTLQDFIITLIPVMPLSFRPEPIYKNMLQDFDFHYRRIMEAVARYKSGNKNNIENINKIYEAIRKFTGVTDGDGSTKSGFASVISEFTKRSDSSSQQHGKIRQMTLGKRQIQSGRTVIIPPKDLDRPPNVLGIPLYLAIEIWKEHLAVKLRKDFSSLQFTKRFWIELLESMPGNFPRFASLLENFLKTEKAKEAGYTAVNFYDVIYSVIKWEIEGKGDPFFEKWEKMPEVVVSGRQPSLHKPSIKSFYVTLTDNNCIEVHSLLNSAYNADHDGDQFWLKEPLTLGSIREALELMSPIRGLRSPKDGSLLLRHTQDSVLGLYSATMLKDNMSSIYDSDYYEKTGFQVYTNLKALEMGLEMNHLKPYDLVSFIHSSGRVYLSTACRILFNGILPNDEGFTEDVFTNLLGIKNLNEGYYCDLKFDGLLVSGSSPSVGSSTLKYVGMSKVTSWALKTFDDHTVHKMLHDMSKFGFTYSDKIAVSLTLEDLLVDLGTEKYLKKAAEHSEKLKEMYFKGIISEEERDQSNIDIYNTCYSLISKNLNSLDRNNNLFIMFDSGARGKRDQILQTVAMIGTLKKNKNTTLGEPLTKPYIKGASVFDTYLMSFSTLQDVASTQNETAVAGATTREAIYAGSGLRVVEEDCGSGIPQTSIRLGECRGTVENLKTGKIDNIDVLIGKHVSEEDTETLRRLHYFLGPERDLTSQCIELLVKAKQMEVFCEEGAFKIQYSLLPEFSNQLLHRVSENLPYLNKGKFITEETIEYIEKTLPKFIPIRTMLTCQSVGGVCAQCYGLYFDRPYTPKVGSYIGIEPAQSIGERAAQLTMDVGHKAGKGGSMEMGISVLEDLISKGTTSKVDRAMIPGYSGYIFLSEDSKNLATLYTEYGEVEIKSDKKLEVISGEYVEWNQPIESGFLLYDSTKYNPTPEVIKFCQDSMLSMFYTIFASSGEIISTRHFEVFCRLSTSLAFVVRSPDPEIKEGSFEFINKISKSPYFEQIEYGFRPSNSREIMTYFGGFPTYFAHMDLPQRLANAVVSQVRTKGKSQIGSIFYGQDVTSDVPKLLSAPKFVETVKNMNIYNDESIDMTKVENTTYEELIRSLETAEPEDFDLDLSEFGLTDETPKPREITSGFYTELEVEQEDLPELGEEEDLQEEPVDFEPVRRMTSFSRD